MDGNACWQKPHPLRQRNSRTIPKTIPLTVKIELSPAPTSPANVELQISRASVPRKGTAIFQRNLPRRNEMEEGVAETQRKRWCALPEWAIALLALILTGAAKFVFRFVLNRKLTAPQ
jgi:hypothetical protein